jgi:GT2 family glycosyltransferase
MSIDPIQYSIVIPYYNNAAILEECLPSVIALRKAHPEITEIIGVNDCSTDQTSALLKENYKEVMVIDNSVNMGFGKTCNKGIAAASNEWIILLNSDITLSTDPITHLNRAISEIPELFQVAFYSFYENGDRFEGQKFIIGKTGLFKTRNNFIEYDLSRFYDSFYACGGHCLISKSKFLTLGGFSDIYEPFYWEDADLSYMGHKAGWRVIFAPQCQVIHKHRGSIRTANKQRFIDIIQTRNKILFFWKNVSSASLWFQHISGLLFRMLTSWIAGDFIFYFALFKAFQRLPLLLKARDAEKSFWKISDLVLFQTGKKSRSDYL